MTRLCLVHLFVVLFSLEVASALPPIQASASVNKSSVRVGENIILTLRLDGATAVPQPALPPLDGFKPVGQYQTVENTPKGRSILFHYLLSPTRPGRISMPSMNILVGGQPVQIPGFSVDVETAKAGAPQGQQPKVGKGRDILLIGECSQPAAFVGQGVMYTLRLLAKPSVRRLEISRSPDFSGFQKVEDGQAAQIPAKQSWHSGELYLDQVLRRYILFPLRPGKLDIGDFEVIAKVEYGQGFAKETPLSGGSDSLSVTPLPAQPPNFSGSVGSFSAVLEKPAPPVAALDQPFTVTIKVEGSGFLPQDPLALQETPLFQKYPAKVEEMSGFVSGSFKSARRYSVTYVPKVVGRTKMPLVGLVFFDPVESKYRRISLGGSDMMIREPSAIGTGQAVHLEPVLHPPAIAASAPYKFQEDTFLLLLSLPFCASLVATLSAGLFRRFLSDPSRSKIRALKRAARREIAKARRCQDTRKRDQFFNHLEKAFAAQVELVTGAHPSGMTRAQVREELERAGVDPHLALAALDAVAGLESVKYTPSAPDLRTMKAAGDAIENAVSSLAKYGVDR